jgi:hypothetical protein
VKKNFIIARCSVVVILLFTVSCREDILPPENLATNVNEPIQINEPNSYAFVINAQNISINVVNRTQINSTTSRISITIVDYSTGYVAVRVMDKQLNNRFNYFGNDDESFYTQSLNGYIPRTVGIKAVDFSGKLKIELRKTF